MSEYIVSLVLMMQQDLKKLNEAARIYLEEPELIPEIEEFVSGYHLSGKEAMERVLSHTEENPGIFEQTGDEFRQNVRLMKEIGQQVSMLEQKFNLRRN